MFKMKIKNIILYFGFMIVADAVGNYFLFFHMLNLQKF